MKTSIEILNLKCGGCANSIKKGISDIENIIDLFDIGVSTALWEGLPQSLVQMRLKRIPIVASNIGGNREIVQQNKNGYLVSVYDHEGFAGRILELISNAEQRRILGCYNDVFTSWDADLMVREQETLYSRLIKTVSARKGNGER